MKTRCLTAALLALAVAAPLLAEKTPPAGAGKYDAWLKEEVAYIISPKERDVFSELETDHDRDAFIEEFWRQRDPTPGTPRNEFKEEHYRRIAFANRRFGSPTSKQGWKTDRGRIYIKLGPPSDVQRIMERYTYPIELWYYTVGQQVGHSSILRLLFFQEFGAGEYRLYNPVTDGPKRLVPDPTIRPEGAGARQTAGLSRDNGGAGPARAFPAQWDDEDRNAYLLLSEFGKTEVSEATYSLTPGAGSMGGQILASSLVLADVETFPQKRVRDDYALDFKAHKPTVEVSYSVSFMNNRSRLAVLEQPSGEFDLHYLIVPDNLTLENFRDTYFADLRTNIRLTDARGATIYQGEKSIPVELSRQELQAVKDKSFQLYDVLPVLPGVYKVNFLLENTVSKEFTTLEKTIAVPGAGTLAMSPVILARKAEKVEGLAPAAQAFQVGAFRVYPSINNAFQVRDKIFVFFQVHGLSSSLKETGSVELSVAAAGGAAAVEPRRRRIAEAGGGPCFLEEIGGEALKPGTYAVKAVLLDGNGRELLADSAPFVITENAVPGVWVAAQAGPPPDSAESMPYAVAYAQALLAGGDAAGARSALERFATSKAPTYELCECLGRATQAMGEYRAAVGYYQKALAIRGGVAEVLNALGECHLFLGEREQAVKAWQKSLEIKPDQERIRNLVRENER